MLLYFYKPVYKVLLNAKQQFWNYTFSLIGGRSQLALVVLSALLKTFGVGIPTFTDENRRMNLKSKSHLLACLCQWNSGFTHSITNPLSQRGWERGWSYKGVCDSKKKRRFVWWRTLLVNLPHMSVCQSIAFCLSSWQSAWICMHLLVYLSAYGSSQHDGRLRATPRRRCTWTVVVQIGVFQRRWDWNWGSGEYCWFNKSLNRAIGCFDRHICRRKEVSFPLPMTNPVIYLSNGLQIGTFQWWRDCWGAGAR